MSINLFNTLNYYMLTDILRTRGTLAIFPTLYDLSVQSRSVVLDTIKYVSDELYLLDFYQLMSKIYNYYLRNLNTSAARKPSDIVDNWLDKAVAIAKPLLTKELHLNEAIYYYILEARKAGDITSYNQISDILTVDKIMDSEYLHLYEKLMNIVNFFFQYENEEDYDVIAPMQQLIRYYIANEMVKFYKNNKEMIKYQLLLDSSQIY